MPSLQRRRVRSQRSEIQCGKTAGSGQCSPKHPAAEPLPGELELLAHHVMRGGAGARGEHRPRHRLLPLAPQSFGDFWKDALSVLMARERARIGLAASKGDRSRRIAAYARDEQEDAAAYADS